MPDAPEKPPVVMRFADIDCCGTCKLLAFTMTQRGPMMLCVRLKTQPMPLKSPNDMLRTCDDYERNDFSAELTRS